MSHSSTTGSVYRWLCVATAIAIHGAAVHAQKPPAVRQIGALERMAPDSFALGSISTALAMPRGRVMINDIRGRRVLLFDSKLARATIVADQRLAGVWGGPGFDTRGHLVYFGGRNVPGILMLRRGMAFVQDGHPTDIARILAENSEGAVRPGIWHADSSVVVRIDLETRVLDTAAWIRFPRKQQEIKLDDNGLLTSIATTPDPLPLIDQWAVLRDGTIAIVRGRDFHVDWLDASGRWSSTPKMPFDWQRVDDARKQALIDSTVADWQAQYDRNAASRLNGAGRGAGAGGTGGRGGGSGGGGGRPAELAPTVVMRSPPATCRTISRRSPSMDCKRTPTTISGFVRRPCSTVARCTTS